LITVIVYTKQDANFKYKDIEVSALKLESVVFNTCVIAVYRAPCGNFNSLPIGLDSIIKSLYKVELKFYYI
jgi:hypothetical protein